VDAPVIGCGVIGLSTAIRLQEAGLSVEIWTANPPEKSTSIVAAATWYPYRAYPEDKVLGWGSRTYKFFEYLAGDPQSGVHRREGVELSRDTLPDPWWGVRCGGLGGVKRTNCRRVTATDTSLASR
jgi:D-amino-acid oxidase